MTPDQIKKAKLEKDIRKIKFVIIFFSFLIILFIYRTLPKRSNVKVITDKNTNQEFLDQTLDRNDPISEEDLKEEPGKYIDTDLRFSFRYPQGSSVKTCEIGKCLYIPENAVRIEFLESSYYEHALVKDALLEIDLFCNSETELLTTSCTNVKMADYVTPNNVLGYILYRTKYIRQINADDGYIKNGTYHEKVYLFPIKDEKYGIAVLTVDYPEESKQEVLKNIADTFKLL